MTTFIVIIIAALAIMTATALFGGLVAFHRDGEKIKNGSSTSHLEFGKDQNRFMTRRVQYQGLAILAIALLGMLASS